MLARALTVNVDVARVKNLHRIATGHVKFDV